MNALSDQNECKRWCHAVGLHDSHAGQLVAHFKMIEAMSAAELPAWRAEEAAHINERLTAEDQEKAKNLLTWGRPTPFGAALALSEARHDFHLWRTLAKESPERYTPRYT